MSTMFVISGDGLGRGDEGLGRRLMVKFVRQFAGDGAPAARGRVLQRGREPCCHRRRVADALKTLEADGVDLIACGTCLDHFRIRDKIVAGRVSDMREIVTTMAASEKVVVV